MITAAELALLQADAVREMPDRFTLLRFVEDSLDEMTLVATPVYVVVEDDVPAFVTRNVRSATSAEQTRPLEHDNYTVVLDAQVTDIRNGDLLMPLLTGDPATPTLIVMSVTTGSATAGRRVFADRFGDGQTEPSIVIVTPAGFGFSPNGVSPS